MNIYFIFLITIFDFHIKYIVYKQCVKFELLVTESRSLFKSIIQELTKTISYILSQFSICIQR